MSDNTLAKDFTAARRVSTPIALITTSDQWATIDTLAKLLVEADAGVLTHDVIHGLRAWPGHKASEEARVKMGIEPEKSIVPITVLAAAETRLDKNTVLFMMNAHRHLGDLGTRFLQAVSNLRDELKRDKRMLVLLAPGMTVPPELEGDILVLDEPRPSPAELEHIITRQVENAQKGHKELPMPAGKELAQTVDALAGLKKFEAEQVTALSLTKAGLDREQVWARKRKAIENTEGLSVVQESITFAAIGGNDNIKRYYRQYFDGPNAPAGIVFIDEIEKDTAGMSGDNTGVAQRQHKALLTHMQDKKARGVIHVGQPGAGKSAIAKALGKEAGIPVIAMNLGDLLSSHVGASELLMRNALKTIDAVCQGRALFVATCNDLKGLSPELRGRFKNGTFFFDLPTADERETIWQLYLKKYGRKLNEKRPRDDGWVGREIEACVDQAYSLGCSIVEAGQYIVPQAVAMRDAVKRRREEANGSIISASYAGPYSMTRAEVEHGRELAAVGDRVIELER